MNTIIITLTSAAGRHAAVDLAMLIATLRASGTKVYFLQSTKDCVSINLN